MIINSLLGSFSVVSSVQNHDKLCIKSKSKEVLMHMFDEKRITNYESMDYNYSIEVCKQEFAHTMIILIKEVNYPDFIQEISEMEISKNKVMA
ncbi:hypothetical protein [Aquiflexum lacus]|uniref:hypothetical protein n=1 Tax=Aquiflexum lacus TaxID=2483805 RepID=UPI0018953F1F|nr:hypothetical protein [Aquiflexum lacus]